jgi:hypothetical protein
VNYDEEAEAARKPLDGPTDDATQDTIDKAAMGNSRRSCEVITDSPQACFS